MAFEYINEKEKLHEDGNRCGKKTSIFDYTYQGIAHTYSEKHLVLISF